VKKDKDGKVLVSGKWENGSFQGFEKKKWVRLRVVVISDEHKTCRYITLSLIQYESLLTRFRLSEPMNVYGLWLLDGDKDDDHSIVSILATDNGAEI
jgi:hypothetical protein